LDTRPDLKSGLFLVQSRPSLAIKWQCHARHMMTLGNCHLCPTMPQPGRVAIRWQCPRGLRSGHRLCYTINRAMLSGCMRVLTSWVICGTISNMNHSAPHPSLYGTSRREVARCAGRWATELLHEELSQADRSDEVCAAQHDLDLEHEALELARAAAGQDPNADVDDWIPPDVHAVSADRQRTLVLAKAAHGLMPVLRAADRILAPTVLATTAARAQVQIHAIIPRREQLAALQLARLRAISATLAAQLLPAPRAAALPRAA